MSKSAESECHAERGTQLKLVSGCDERVDGYGLTQSMNESRCQSSINKECHPPAQKETGGRARVG
jgi:hypothetical protein